MAHFAELDSNNVVLRVVVVANEELLDENGDEQESLGVAFCEELFGGGTWVQTSYNGNIRRVYAPVGALYRTDVDAFQTAQPFPSWVFNDTLWEFEAPVPMPAGDGLYQWDEETTSWQLIGG